MKLIGKIKNMSRRTGAVFMAVLQMRHMLKMRMYRLYSGDLSEARSRMR